jgi:hypothetical protein
MPDAPETVICATCGGVAERTPWVYTPADCYNCQNCHAGGHIAPDGSRHGGVFEVLNNVPTRELHQTQKVATDGGQTQRAIEDTLARGNSNDGGPDPRQASLDEAASDAPTTGVGLDERTHFAHVRYAASNHPGVIWFDPRDGHEKLSFDVDKSKSALELDEPVLSAIQLYGHRNRCGIVDPGESWVVEWINTELVEFEPVGLDADPDTHVETHRGTEVFESQAAAREAARERYTRYRDAPYRDAVAFRRGGA